MRSFPNRLMQRLNQFRPWRSSNFGMADFCHGSPAIEAYPTFFGCGSRANCDQASFGCCGTAILAWPTFAVAVQQLKPIRLFWPWLGPANRDLASFGRYGSEIVAARKGVCRGMGRCPLQRYSKSGDSHFSTLRNGLVYPAQHM